MDGAMIMSRLQNKLPLILYLVIVIAILSFLSLLVGPTKIAASKLFIKLLHPDNSNAAAVIWQVRMPRLMLTAFVGMLLSSAASIFIGVSGHWLIDSKASRGVFALTTLFAAIGLLMMALGLRINDLFYSFLGSIDAATWQRVLFILPWVIIGIIVAIFYSKDLNAMVFGEYTAKTLGISVESVRTLLVLIAVVLLAVALPVIGVPGLVWLVLPYYVRMLAGFNYKYLAPATILAGVAAVIFCDIFSRVLFPVTIPLGIIMSAFGAPLHLYAIYRRRLGL